MVLLHLHQVATDAVRPSLYSAFNFFGLCFGAKALGFVVYCDVIGRQRSPHLGQIEGVRRNAYKSFSLLLRALQVSLLMA